MWANAQCDGRPAEYRLRPLFNARKKERKKKKIEITGQKYNGLPYYIGRP